MQNEKFKIITIMAKKTTEQAAKALKETMTEYKLQGWVARDECSDDSSCGETNLFVSQLKPNRLANTSPGFGMWVNRGEFMALPADMFPQLTYKDEPVEVEIIIKTKEG